jgi:hypothetical protein
MSRFNGLISKTVETVGYRIAVDPTSLKRGVMKG